MSTERQSSMPSTNELIQYITYTGESDNIDAKCPMKWDGAEASAGLAKDVAAFANSRDGGVIVIGKHEVSPGKFISSGVTEEQAESFATTKVATWINNHFAPPIRLVCHRQEYDGKTFIVIMIAEFNDVPAICIKPFFSDPKNPKRSLLTERTIYVRNSNAESAPLTSVEELRSLIGLATRKRGDELLAIFDAMLKGRPLVQPPTHEEQFERQLAEVTDAITPEEWEGNAGAWLFSFHPSVFMPNRWPDVAQLETLIFHRSVRMRNEFPPSYKGTHPREWGIANDFYGEPWGLARSGLFVYRKPFRENDIAFQHPFRNSSTGERVLELSAGEWIEYEWNMEVMVECFMFLARMADAFGPDDAIEYQFIAAPLTGRTLVSRNPDIRIGIEKPAPCRASGFYRTAVSLIGELRANWREQCADTMAQFFELFPDHGIRREGLRHWVDRFEQRGVEERSFTWKKVH